MTSILKLDKDVLPPKEAFAETKLALSLASKFPPPVGEKWLAKVKDGEQIVTLWRGGWVGLVDALKDEMSAGGLTADDDVKAPSDDDVKKQVGGSQPGVKTLKVPEFTTNPTVAWSFSGTKDSCLIAIAIKRKYLTKGSVVEGGWCCHGSAPIVGIDIHEGKMPKAKNKTLNAD